MKKSILVLTFSALLFGCNQPNTSTSENYLSELEVAPMADENELLDVEDLAYGEAIMEMFDPITAITTAATVITKGYDLFRKYKGDRESAKQSQQLIDYLSKIDKEIAAIEVRDKKTFDEILKLEGLIKIIVKDINSLKVDRLDASFNRLKAITDEVKTKNTYREQQSEFSKNVVDFRTELYTLLQQEYRPKWVLELPKYVDYFLFYKNINNLKSDFVSPEKTDLIRELDARITRLEKASNKQEVIVLREVANFYYFIGQGSQTELLNMKDETNKKILKITNFTSMNKIEINFASTSEKKLIKIKDKLTPLSKSIPQNCRIGETLNLLMGSLVLYRENM